MQILVRCKLLTADITFTMKFFEVRRFVEYTALSYLWDTKRMFTHPPHCGIGFNILDANLASALHLLRLPDEPPFFD